MQDFPNYFAILRNTSMRGPYWQFFEAIYHDNDNAHQIRSASWESQIISVNDSGILPFQENAVRFARIRLSNGSVRQIVYWFVPVFLDTGIKDRVPVLDFNFKAWLPRPNRRIHAAFTNEITETMASLWARFSSLSTFISYIPENNNDLQPNTLIRPPSPPRTRAPTPEQIDSDDETQSIMSVYPQMQEPWLGSPRRLDFPALPPTPSPQQESRTPLPIPEHVGHLLIKHAQESNDSCPITATQYSDISQLSVTSCFHVFEHEALNIWRQEHTSCPVCRTTIINVVTR